MIMADKTSRLLNFCSLSLEKKEEMSSGTPEDRLKETVPLPRVEAGLFLQIEPLTVPQEVVAMMCLAIGPPNGVFTMPFLTWLYGHFVLGNVTLAFQILFLALLPLAFMPQEYQPNALHSSLAQTMVQYFSFRVVYEDIIPVATPQRPQVTVAPPHGVFPYGNLLTMLAWPCLTGRHANGLCSTVPLVTPIFKQVLQSIGCIDASRQTAQKALAKFPFTIGISTGGVAEVFETNADDEYIVLRQRLGFIKLAIRTGADLIPCYVFGNTKLLSCWIPPGRSYVEPLARKLGVAFVLPYGRAGLPIPYRIPVLTIIGKPIPTYHIKCEEPTDDQIQQIQEQVIASLQRIFDKYKVLYGWNDKKLIIL
jgi:hypothetical protein